jgi:diadenylate cyclase
LAEESDAVIVVVSEETGAIAYAYKGQLVRGVTLEELRAFLSSVLVPAARSKTLSGRWRPFWVREKVKRAGPVKEPASG